MNRLAILDWGIGGAGFWKEWKRKFPNAGVVYYSDSGYTPYGKLTEVELIERLVSRVKLLQDRGVTHVVFACNAASTVVDAVKQHVDAIQVQGVIEATKQWMIDTFQPDHSVHLIGGRRTIESRMYESVLVGETIVGQPLSALVEGGELFGETVSQIIKELLSDVSGDLVLACTHYVALKDEIEKSLPKIRCHDPIPAVVEAFAKEWESLDQTLDDLFLSSGDLQLMKLSAAKAFGVQW